MTSNLKGLKQLKQVKMSYNLVSGSWISRGSVGHPFKRQRTADGTAAAAGQAAAQ